MIKDSNILLSIINTKLRDNYDSSMAGTWVWEEIPVAILYNNGDFLIFVLALG